MHLQVKAELEDVRSEHVREMEGLLENIRQLNNEFQLQTLIINHFIPKPFQVGWLNQKIFERALSNCTNK